MVCLYGAIGPVFAQKNNNVTGNPEFDSLILKAVEFRYVNWDSAMMMMRQAEKLQPQSIKQKAVIGNQLGALYYIKGDYSASIREYSQVLTLLENENEPAQQVSALNGRGLIYISQHAFEQAASIFQKCIEINLAREDSLSLGLNYLNLGISLAELGKIQEALDVLRKGINVTTNFPKSTPFFMNLNRQGQIQLDLGNYAEAKVLFNTVLTENPTINNWEHAFSLTGLGLVAMAENNPEEALKSGLEGYEFAKLAKAYWDQERATRLISEVYEELGNYEKALLYSRLNKTHSDSLYNENKSSEISFHQLKSTESEKETLEQEKLVSLQRAKISNYLLIGLSLILILLIVTLLLNRRWLNQKEALNKQLNQLNDEKTKLFSILSHDLKAPINSIKQVLELQELNLLTEDERLKSNHLLLNQVRRTDQMIDQLLRWSHGQMKGIVTDKEHLDLAELINNVIAQNELAANKKEIQIHFDAETTLSQIFADKTHLQIILQNCLQNALKFSEIGGNIHLTVEDIGNHLRLSIKDQGVGMTFEKLKEINEKQTMVTSTEGTNKEKGTGLGLLLVKQFLAKNNGELTIESELKKGTILKLTFEKAS